MKWFFIVLFSFSSVKCLERKIFYEQNPGCSSNYNFTVYYIKAEGPNDTLHYIWDFFMKPTIFIALTPKSDEIHFDCDKFQKNINNSFYFQSNPIYSFSLVLNKIIEFNDIDDDGYLTPSSINVSFDTAQFKWEISKNFQGDSKVVGLEMKSSHYSNGNKTVNGSLYVQLVAFGTGNHDDQLPKLLHSPNSTQCTIKLDKIITSSGFNNSRFAIELILVSSDKNNASSIIRSRKNLDDENSPGVFSMVDIMTPQAQDKLYKGAFLQWRPIVYTAKIPTIGNSTELVTYDLNTVVDAESGLKNSLVYKFYGSKLKACLVQRTVVSLGSKEDGFYKETNYSSWTFLISYGSPEDERFSLLIITVISIGLGLPALLIFIGGTYMCVRRLSRNKDELCLER